MCPETQRGVLLSPAEHLFRDEERPVRIAEPGARTRGQDVIPPK
jgi:hypothetical protein